MNFRLIIGGLCVIALPFFVSPASAGEAVPPHDAATSSADVDLRAAPGPRVLNAREMDSVTGGATAIFFEVVPQDLVGVVMPIDFVATSGGITESTQEMFDWIGVIMPID